MPHVTSVPNCEHVFRDPRMKHPYGAEWERARKVFSELA